MKNPCCHPVNAGVVAVRVQYKDYEKIRYCLRCFTCGRFVSKQMMLPFQKLDESIKEFSDEVKMATITAEDLAQALSTISRGRLTVKQALENIKKKLKEIVRR